MFNLSSKKLRVLAGAAAVAGFAALAVPTQAAQASGGVPQPVASETGVAAESQAKVQSAQPSTKSYATDTAIVKNNKLYKTGAIAASKCKEVRGPLSTANAVKAYDQSMVNCMWAAWAPTLKATGSNYHIKPTLVMYTSRAKTYCGVISQPTSYYCGHGAKAEIYIPGAYVVNFYKQNPVYARAYATNTIAHEYGHHVQYMTGILSASWSRQYAISGSAAKLEENRRRELQASCLGSAMIGANKRYYPMAGALYTQWKYVVSHSGDIKGYPRDHGSFANHNFWSTAGFNASSSATYAKYCNTFNAASSRVS
ncbi:MAG: uncharacterized protein QOH03_2450 [Kribbellaceae bacterium]|nr:uncharacterized protein [Kribbellaceae bacterium]